MNKKIKDYLKRYSENLRKTNKLIVAAYLEFNNIYVKNNTHILSLLADNDKDEINSFLKLIREHSSIFNFEDVINLFEIAIPKDKVVVNGAIYTPKDIREFITYSSLSKLGISKKIKVADIACGSGAFLYTASKYLHEEINKSLYDIYKDNIYGLDISGYAIERTKILLILFAVSNGEDIEEFEFNLYVGNTLEFKWSKVIQGYKGFDSIIGNPPYVRTKNIDEKTKKLMKSWKVASSGNTDLYIPFFEIGVDNLIEGGILGYITVNTFKRSVNARALRNFLHEQSIDFSMIDFGSNQVFEEKMTYTSIVFIENKKSTEIKYKKMHPEDIRRDKLFKYTSIEYKNLNHKKGWLLSDNKVLKNIHKIEDTGSPLGNKFSIKNGLATLQNSLFIFKPFDEDNMYYYMKYNNAEYKIEKKICRDVIKPNKLKKSDEISSLKEKIIFPYSTKNRVSTVLDEDIFKKEFPYAFKYLLEYKALLLSRDKGKKKKYRWYEFGRSQSINDYGKKLLFPYMSNKPYFVYTDNEELMFYAGYAIFSDSEKDLKVVEKILKSDVFWYYIKHASKPYSSDYFALAKNYVKDFGICDLSSKEEEYLLKSSSEDDINRFLFTKYNLIF